MTSDFIINSLECGCSIFQHTRQPLASTSGQHPTGADNSAYPHSPTHSQSPISTSLPLRSFTLYARLKEPEVILFADPTDLNSRVAVLHVSMVDTIKSKLIYFCAILQVFYSPFFNVLYFKISCSDRCLSHYIIVFKT